MKKLFLVLFILLFSFPVFADQIIQPYKNSYIITGFNKDSQTKMQFSAKWGLIKPFNSGLFLSYTQLSKWNIYDKSAPFKETNYNPSVFWEKENLFKLDFLRIIPYEHKSNGRDGKESRGTDRYFGEAQISSMGKLKIGVRYKGGGFYIKANNNSNIQKYVGLSETELFFVLRSGYKYLDNFKLYLKGEWTRHYYWSESGLIVVIPTPAFSLRFYAQLWWGYGEWMTDYDKFTKTFRIGFVAQ